MREILSLTNVLDLNFMWILVFDNCLLEITAQHFEDGSKTNDGKHPRTAHWIILSEFILPMFTG